MATTMVRVDEKTHDTIKNLASEAGLPMSLVVRSAIQDYERKRFFEEMNAAYEALRADPQAWAEELEERRAWEATLMDGIDDE